MSYFDNNKPFGIVTVMDVKVYDFDEEIMRGSTAPLDVLDMLSGDEPIVEIDHMQVATLSTDGPNVTINGGKYNNALIKYGKTARCEMTDALAQADALVHLGGAERDGDGVLSITDKFGDPVTIVGDTFVVDKETGKHIPMKIILYKFFPDSTPSFAFDSGNAATFDLNGDLLAVELGDGTFVEGDDCPGSNGLFFSFVPVDCNLEPVGQKYSIVFLDEDNNVAPVHGKALLNTPYDLPSDSSVQEAIDGDSVLVSGTDYSTSTGTITLLTKPHGLVTIILHYSE